MFNLKSICPIGDGGLFLAAVSEKENPVPEHLGGGIFLLHLSSGKKFLITCAEVPESKLLDACRGLQAAAKKVLKG